jgi:hypothetical protein
MQGERIQSIKNKVKAKTYRSTRHMSLAELIGSLGPGHREADAEL